MQPKVKSQRKGAIVFLVFAALAFGTMSGVLIATDLGWLPQSFAGSGQTVTVEPSRFLTDTQQDFRKLVEAVRPAVVTIRARGIEIDTSSRMYQSPFDIMPPFDFFNMPDPFNQQDDRRSQREQQIPQVPQTIAEGSGFIVDRQGYILTNNHVVSGASAVTVILDEGGQYRADIVGADPETDVAVLKISSDDDLPYIELGDSEALQVGDWVMAIGNPFGTLAGTVTVGIVSALNREDLPLPGNTYYKDFIQTDAAINFGNSGGPLLDIYGRVVGINTAITSEGTGIGFAIPINMAKTVYQSLIEHGEVVRGWVGLTIQDIDHDLAQHFGSGDITGALIADVVAGDPADEAGLRAGDVILEVGGTEVTGKSKATQLIASLPVGEPSDMVIWRDGREMTIQVTPARRGEGPQRAEEDRTGSVKEKPELSPLSAGDLGIDVVELTSSVRRRYQIPDDVDGVLVSNVNPLSPAIEKGLIEGNIVSEVNGNAVDTDSEFYEQVDSAANEWTNSGTSALFKLMIQDQDGIWRPIYAAIPFE